MSSKFTNNKKTIALVALVSVVLVTITMISAYSGKSKRYEIGTSKSKEQIQAQINEDEADQSSIDLSKNTYEENSPLENEKIYVHISGAVKNPSVIELGSESRLNIAVEMAGGLSENADSDGVNLAQKLTDGAQYIIPEKGQEFEIKYSGQTPSYEGSIPSSHTNQEIDSEGRININLAGKEKLMTLPGIGDVLSQRIIDHRTENGPFKSVEEISSVSGIGDKKFNDIKAKIFAN